MSGANPFERRVVEEITLRSLPKAPTAEVLPEVPVARDLQEEPALSEDSQRNPLKNLITGESYEDLLLLATRISPKPLELEAQDRLDDDRFEHLHGEDWKDLDDEEERLRAARSIARREGPSTYASANERHIMAEVENFEAASSKQQRQKILWIGLLIWTLIGAVGTGAEGGIVGFFAGGVFFFFGGAFFLWVISLFRGLGESRGRAV